MKRILSVLLAAALLVALFAAAAVAEQPKVLNWFIEGEVPTMDSTKVYDTLSGEGVYFFNDTLYRLDNNSEPFPSLAVDLPEFSEDGKTVTITIRDDAYWNNGDKITADDIVYAAQRLFDPAVGSQSTTGVQLKNRDAVRAGEMPVEALGIEAVSDTVVVLTLEAPDPYVTKKLADTAFSPANRAFAEGLGEAYGLNADSLLASGAYVLKDWNGTDISWRYEKNPYFWDKDNVYFDEITIQVVKDANTGINLYEAGVLDAYRLPSDYVPTYEGQPDLVKVDSLTTTNIELGISSSTVLQNENIRKALMYAIDREEMASIVLNGAAAPLQAVIPNGAAASPDGQGINESFPNLVYYDLEAAQAYFAKGLEELGVDSVALRLVTSDTDDSIKVGTRLQSQLQDNLPGLTINLANVPASVRFNEMMSFQFDLALGGWTGEYDPTAYVKQFETSFEHNHAQWKSEELTALVSALDNEDGTDFATRWEHLKEGSTYLIENAVVIPIYQRVDNYLVRPGLENYITRQLGYTKFDLSRAYFAE